MGNELFLVFTIYLASFDRVPLCSLAWLEFRTTCLKIPPVLGPEAIARTPSPVGSFSRWTPFAETDSCPKHTPVSGPCELPSSPLQSVVLSFVYRLHPSSPECQFSEKTQVLNVIAMQSLLLITPPGKQKVSPFPKRLPPFEDTAAE